MVRPASSHMALLAGVQSRMPAPIACVFAAVSAGLMVFAPWILLFAPCVLINIAFAAVFAGSLRASLEPVVSMFAPLDVGSLFSNYVCYVLLAFLIATDYAWRRLRFPHHRHARFVTFVKNALNGRFCSLRQRR